MSQHSAGARFRQAVKESTLLPWSVASMLTLHDWRPKAVSKQSICLAAAWQPALAVSLIWALPQWKMC